VKIAVDAMGGDRAPDEVVDGAALAVKESGVSVVLVGDAALVKKRLEAVGPPPGLETVHCTQVAGMDEAPVEVLRRKKDASIRVAFDLIKDGRADAVVSAGNSGATLAAAAVVLGRMPGVDRPGIAGVLPTLRGPVVVMDMGANIQCRPGHLFQFGVMAEAFAQETLKIDRPRISLLSIGEESGKGTDVVKKAHDLFKASPMNFIGNLEGRDVFKGDADVIICDGFVGNVVLKLSEGLVEALTVMLKEELTADPLSRLGATLSRKAYQRFRKKTDYAEYGGAPLLGVNGVGLISHGASSAAAIKNAILRAADMVQTGLPARLEARLKRFVSFKNAV
jgi:glycerol-3-phosphate acyltransferase PlsX